MDTPYPDRHHPVMFLVDALNDMGVHAEFAKDERTAGCWGLFVNGWRVIWLIDNRWEHERKDEDGARLVRAFRKETPTLICCAQKPDAERMNTFYGDEAYAKWLPLAMTPGYDVIPNPPPLRVYGAGFIGYVRDVARSMALIHLGGTVDTYAAQGLFGESAVNHYRMCKIGVNVPTRYGHPLAYDSANMRCFEIPPTGAVLLTSHEDYLEELGFVDQLTCVTYRSPDDLAIKAHEILQWSNDKREQVAQNGRQLVLNKHTYRHRAEQVIEWISQS